MEKEIFETVEVNDIKSCANKDIKLVDYMEFLRINPLIALACKENIENKDGILGTAIFTVDEDTNIIGYKYKKKPQIISTKDGNFIQ